MKRIVLLPGDGIGPEVMNEARKVLNVIDQRFALELDIIDAAIGGDAIDRYGTPLPEETLNLCLNSAAVLLGAVGGPRWDHLPAEQRPETGGLLALRKALNLYANIRPIEVFTELRSISPLTDVRWNGGVDLVTVRELSSGIYYGQPRQLSSDEAVDTMRYKRVEIERIARLAFELARERRRRVTSVDKANVLACSKLWRQVVGDVARSYPDVELRHMYIDNAAMQLILSPHQFDVILTENMFGDILSDETAALAGSVGMLPSASLGDRVNLYEPAGGSAPDIAGQGIANPLAQILSVALLLEHSLAAREAASAVRSAVRHALHLGYRPADVAGEWTPVSTSEAGDAVVACLQGEELADRSEAQYPLHYVFSGFADPV